MINQTNNNGLRVTAHFRPNVSRDHNRRVERIAKGEVHIDLARPHEIIYELGKTLAECFEKIFGESIEKHNSRQKRKDRKIKNYLDTILNDNRKGKHKNARADGSRKPEYEAILQIGNRDNKGDEELCVKVLKKFVSEWIPKNCPNIRPTGIYLHWDEFSLDAKTGERIYSPPHIHFDFVYIAHALTPEEQEEEKRIRAVQKAEEKKTGKKTSKAELQQQLVNRWGKALMTGPELQASMSAALMEMGFVTSKKRGTAQTQFEEFVRHGLQDFAEQMGIKIDRTPGMKHPHVEKKVYQQQKDLEKKELELKIINMDMEERENNLVEAERLTNDAKATAKFIKEQNITFENEVKKLYDKDGRFIQRNLPNFIKNIKKIVDDLSAKLCEANIILKRFWQTTPEGFIKLGNTMLTLKYKNFGEYYDKAKNGRKLKITEAINKILNFQKKKPNSPQRPQSRMEQQSL